MRLHLRCARVRLLLIPGDPLTQDLLRLADGDRSAFEEVYRTAQPRVERLVHKLLGGDPDVEDVAQRALIKVFERASEFDADRGPALPWILGVAAWECRSHRKKRARSRECPVEAPPERPAPHCPERALLDADLEAALHAAIGTLAPTDRETLLAALEHTRRPEVSRATFRKRLQRALTRLKSAWRAEHG